MIDFETLVVRLIENGCVKAVDGVFRYCFWCGHDLDFDDKSKPNDDYNYNDPRYHRNDCVYIEALEAIRG